MEDHGRRTGVPGDPMWGMPAGSLVKDSGPIINKALEYNARTDSYQEVPMEFYSGTAKQNVEIIGFGDPVAQPGPFIDSVHEKVQPVEAELADLVTRQIRRLPNGGSMEVAFLEEDGLHFFVITKMEVRR